MTRCTQPAILLVVTVLAVVLLTFALSERRRRLADVRVHQARTLSALLVADQQADYLQRRRTELLSNPLTIKEVAREQYGFLSEGQRGVVPWTMAPPAPRPEPLQLRIVDSGWERFLGEGQFIWRLPVLALGFCAAAFVLIGLAGHGPDRTPPQPGARPSG